MDIDTIVKFVEEWRSNQGIGEPEKPLTDRQLVDFARDLREQIKEISVAPVIMPGSTQSWSADARPIPYSGDVGGVAGWKLAKAISETGNGDVFYISDTPGGQLLNSTEFANALIVTTGGASQFVGLARMTSLMSGELTEQGRGKFGVADVEAINDQVSQKLMQEMAHGDVRTLTPAAEINRVFARTELPALLDNPQVTAINAVPKEELTKLLAESGSLEAVNDAVARASAKLLDGTRYTLTDDEKFVASVDGRQLYAGTGIEGPGLQADGKEIKAISIVLHSLVEPAEQLAPEALVQSTPPAAYLNSFGTSQGQNRGLSIETCKELITEFCAIYPVAADISYKVRHTQEELYGPEASKEKVGTILGAFSPGDRQADFAASNFRNTDEFKATLRHEVLGHAGINTFDADQKAGILNAISEARDQPVLRGLWRKIDQLYDGQSERVKAEEVYAFMTERIDHERPVDPIAAEKSYKEVCLDGSRLMTERDLMNIASVVAQGMQDRSRAVQDHPLENYDLNRKEDKMDSPKKPFHETVAEKLIEQLKEGTAPWQKPWEPGLANTNMPFNPTTGNRYKGINALQLMSEGRDDQRWMTYKQASALDAQVRKGEKGTQIQFWKFSEEQNKTDESGKPILDAKGQPVKESVTLERPRVFFATVFNAEQIDGLPPQQARQEQTWDAVDRAEKILQASGATIRHSEGDRAFYRPSTDSIHLPNKDQFPTAGNYYATALHELGHWTGHEKRLDRDLVHPFGSEGYAKEELRAEIASMILGDQLGIGHDPEQHAAYVGSWIKALQEDPLEIFRAAADAEKIQGYVLGLEQQLEQQQQAEQSVIASLESKEAVRDALNVQLEPHKLRVEFDPANPDSLLSLLRADGSAVSDPDSTQPKTFSWTTTAAKIIDWFKELLGVQPDQQAAPVAESMQVGQQQPTPPAPQDPEAYFDSVGVLREWDTAERMPDTWSGVAKAPGPESWTGIAGSDKYTYVRQDAESFSAIALAAETLEGARNEAEVHKALNMDVKSFLTSGEVHFENFVSFRGAAAGLKLEDELKAYGIHTVGQLTGVDPEQFYDRAHDRLSVVFQENANSTAPFLKEERKAVAEAFAEKATQLHQSYQQGNALQAEKELNAAQLVAAFLASNHNLAPAKVAENTRNAEPAVQALLADPERLAVISDQVADLLTGINQTYIAETKAVIATTLQRPDAQEEIAAAQAARQSMPASVDRDQAEAQMVADFIARNMNLLPAKIAENTMNAPAELKAILADESRMAQLDNKVDRLLAGINETYIDRTKAVIAETLGRADAPALVDGADQAEAVLRSASPPQDTPALRDRDAQLVAAFLASNHNLAPAKVAENTRNAEPAVQALLADPERLAVISDQVADLLSGINQTYIAETKAVIATTLQRPDAQEEIAAAQAARQSMPASVDRDQAEAQMVADFIARNMNLLPAKIAENTMNAPAELKAILADESRMEQLDDKVDRLLAGINETYIDRTKAVIAETLGRADAPALVDGADQAEAVLRSVPPPQDASALRDRDAQLVAAFLASNHNLAPAKVAENTRNAEPTVQALLADPERLAIISDQVADLLTGINQTYIAETKAVIATTLQRPDAQQEIVAAQAARQSMPASVDHDQAEAQMVADFIAHNMNLLPSKIAENTMNAPAELKATLAEEPRMAQLDDKVDRLLAGINETYIDRTKAVIADALGKSVAGELTSIAQHATPSASLGLANDDGDNLAAAESAYRVFKGTLLEHGTDNYRFDKEEKTSYFVKFSDENQEEKLVWGIDLKRAMAQSGAQVGDEISLANIGKKEVEVTENVRDAVGAVVGVKKIDAIKNRWQINVEQAAKLTEKPTVESSESMTTNSQAERVEKWTIARIENGTLGQSLVKADQEQLGRALLVVDAMVPVQPDNSFWQRNEFPSDPKHMAGQIEVARDQLGTLLVANNMPLNEYEQAAKLARLNEETVRLNPQSTKEDIAAAQEARKDAEFAVAVNDADLRTRIEAEEQRRTLQSNAAGAASDSPQESQKTLITVPFKEKEEAKALGAKWDRQEQSWYIPTNLDAAPFAKWAQEATKTSAGDAKDGDAVISESSGKKTSEGRVYLAVPYKDRTEAKSAGAEWDKAAKSWFAGPSADISKLEKWKPENVPTQQAPAMTPREEFADALRSIGFVIPAGSEHPIMDGTKQRVSVEGETFKEKTGSGFYVGHMDGHPAGYMKNNKTGAETTWKAKGYTLDPEQKALLAAEAAEKMHHREAEVAKQQNNAAQRVSKELAKLQPVVTATAYMVAKGIDPQAGALTDKEGKTTFLPATDVSGKQWTTQYIQEDGTKRFAKDSKKEGCFHVVGGMAELEKAPAIVIGEGYATAASLKQSLGFATVSAFDSGNLAAVAQALHQKFPDKPVVIAGDDDRHLELTQGVNPGRTKAEEAAKLVGGKAMMPIFAPGENSYPSDLAPVTPADFKKHASTGAGLADEQLAALAKMKQFTDFNDLATKSALGKEGIDRQVRSMVDSVIEKHSEKLSEQLQQEKSQSAVLERENTAKLDELPKRRRSVKVA